MDSETIKKRIQALESERFVLKANLDLNTNKISDAVNEHNAAQKEINIEINKIDGKIDMLNEILIIEAGEPIDPEESKKKDK